MPEKITIQVPRIISFVFLILILIFSYIFISSTLKVQNSNIPNILGINAFALFGIIFFILVIGMVVYQLITGRAPQWFGIGKSSKK